MQYKSLLLFPFMEDLCFGTKLYGGAEVLGKITVIQKYTFYCNKLHRLSKVIT